LNWHPHLHVLAPAGAFRTEGSFVHSPVFDAAVLRGLFQANVMALLLRERFISPELVERMMEWQYSGFHAYAGEEIRMPTAGSRAGALVFVGVPPEDEPPDPPRPDIPWLAARRKSWARLIRRVYEVDPLLCRCGERMRVVGFITQPPVILKILHHIGRRFDPLKLPGRSPPLSDDFRPDRFPRTYGPQ
jgi:hypothetical protein